MSGSISKRRRTSMSSTASLASRGDDDNVSLDLDYQPDVKRKKVSTSRYTDPIEQCQQLYDIIRNHKKEDGTILCEAFIRVPKRRQEPAYYEVVTNPMDMIKIQQKIKMDEYEDIEQMSADVDIMVANAKAFYKPKSQEYKDASDLWDLFIESKCRLFDQDSQSDDGKGKIILKMGKLARRAAAVEARKPAHMDIDGGETSESSTTTDRGDRGDEGSLDGTLSSNLEELFSAVMLANDTDGRPLHTVFQLLPSKKRYPTYYDLIENPIDLKMIATKIQTGIYSLLSTGEYGALLELEKDLLLMCRNACEFNEPGSQIYKDAKTLKRIVATKRADIEHGRNTLPLTPGKTSERIRNRRLRSGLSHSAITAALQYEDDEEDEDDDEEMEEEIEDEQEVEDGGDDDGEGEEGDEDDEVGEGEGDEDVTSPMWILYDSVYSMPHSDPFKRLPSRRYYPDYYKEIKTPISLSKIRMKIRTKEYSNITQVQADLNVMFENAKTYNRPDSSLYKTAVKLQKLMQLKVQELLTAAEDDDEEEDEEDEDGEEESSRDAEDPPPPIITKITNTSDINQEPSTPASTSTTSNSTSVSSNNSSFSNAEATPLLAAAAAAQSMATASANANASSLASSGLGTIMGSGSGSGIGIGTSNVINTPLASKSPSNWKKNKGGNKGAVKESNVNTTPGPGFGNKGKIQIKEEKNTGVMSPKELLRRRYMILYRTLMDYVEPDGRVPITIFMEKPSKKLYPSYYKIIQEPIDMVTIENNIKIDKYGTTDELLKDFTLMFDNCRQYNEEGSLIYDDANKLERLVHDKIRELGPEVGFRTKPKKTKKSPQLLQKMRKLLEVVKEHRDAKAGRQLSIIFQKLPSKTEYPEYYEIIKNPIDLDRIYQKFRTNSYDSLEHLSQDLMLMFDNAYKFNEPDSQVYKDALVLQRLAMQTKLSLSEDDDGIPDVRSAVREVLLSIFTSVYNHQDEEGRCYTDTMAELPEFDEIDGVKVRALSLDLIKSRLDRGFYKRLDTFQKDIFLCLERCRDLSRTDSQLFEDSIELQSLFIKIRDECCGNGSILRSPALKYTKFDLDVSVESLRAEKKLKEVPQDEDASLIEIKKEEAAAAASSQSESYNEQTFNIGDFVYVSPSLAYGGSGDPLATADGNSSGSGSLAKAAGIKANVACIQKLWTEPDGTKMFEGIFFFRPDQTYHLPTRKFLQKELFRSEVRSSHRLSEISGKCWVMTVKGKEYFQYAPEGYGDDDVYVCEYRYSSRGRAFTKLKTWAFSSDRVKLVLRPKPLEPIRVASIFRDRVEKHKEELKHIEDDALDKIPKEEFQNIEMMMPAGGKEGFVFYEQYNLPCGPVRAGDYVYVRVENTKKLVARVDTMWSDNDVTNFHGPWFTTLSEISPTSVPSGRVFYKNEIFQSSIEDTNPLLSICGKCCVLDVPDYIKFRPTEVPEEDVYVCESLYEEAKRQIKKLDSLKKVFRKDPNVHQDEFYYFRKPITLSKVDLDGTPVPEMPKLKVAAKVLDRSVTETVAAAASVSASASASSTPIASSGSDGQESQGQGQKNEKKRLVRKMDIINCAKDISIRQAQKTYRVGRNNIHKWIKQEQEMEISEDELVSVPSPAVGTIKMELDSAVEDSMDGSPPSIIGDSSSQHSNPALNSISAPGTPAGPSTPTPATPSTTKKSGKNSGKKIVTGYILYSSEVRKSVAEKNPTSSFGEISRIVGNDWRKMTAPEKLVYEERAARMNEEKEKALEAGIDPATITTPSKAKDLTKQEAEFHAALASLKKDPDWIFECCWENCDWQFEDALDLVEHCVQDPKGHVARYFHDLNPSGAAATEGDFQCHWKNCARVKKGVNPFPNLPRLLKHVKDIHIMKGNGRIIHPEMRSKNITSSRISKVKKNLKQSSASNSGTKAGQRKSLGAYNPNQLPNNAHSNPLDSAAAAAAAATASTVVASPPPPQPPPPPEPMFVAVPPKPQKLLHSEAYIRYIESLHNEQKQANSWENTLKATVENTPVPDPDKLPTNWLANGSGQYGSMLDALWALRNSMTADSLGLYPRKRFYPNP